MVGSKVREFLARVVWLPVIAVVFAVTGTVLVLVGMSDLAAAAFGWAVILAILTNTSE